jgi:hypothetical protein
VSLKLDFLIKALAKGSLSLFLISRLLLTIINLKAIFKDKCEKILQKKSDI